MCNVRDARASTTANSPIKNDYEYVRNGTTNLFVAVEPKGGQRIVSVTERRGKVREFKFEVQLYE